MKDLHSWKVNVEQAIQIQENLRDRVILKNTFKEVRTIGGADVAYSKDRNSLFAAMVVLSFPKMETLEIANAYGEIKYIGTLMQSVLNILAIRGWRRM